MARILFVDDDRDSLELYVSLLEGQGHEVTGVTDGVHALATLDRQVFDVLVTDLVMPFIDGDRLVRLIRHRYATDKLFIVALSAAALDRRPGPAHRYIDVYIAKGPVEETAAILLRTIEEKASGNGVLRDEAVRARRITSELLEQRGDLQLILNRMSQGVLAIDSEGVVLYGNQSALALLGVPEEDLLGQPVLPQIEKEEGHFSEDLLDRLAAEGGLRRTTLKLQGGEVIARGEILLLDEQPRRRFLIFLTDVTAEHAFSEALIRSERGYRAIVESTSDLLWTLDTEGNLTYVNPAESHFTGFSAGDYYASGPRLLFGTKDEDELSEILEEAYRACERGESFTMERPLPTKHGELTWSLIRVAPLRDDPGNFIGLRCIATNVHRRHLAENQLRRTVAEREALIQEIHHRVKNSVQLIISMLRLRFSSFPEGEVRRATEEMENRIRVIASVYAHLYEYRQLDRLDGSALLRNVVELAGAEDSRFLVEFEGEPFDISLDQAIPLGLITRELVANVTRHVVPVTEQPELRIAWTVDEERLRLRFEDNGPGFSERSLQNPESLGFLITLALAEQLQGTIEKEAGSGGATVTVTAAYKPPTPLEET
jgi:PAS domain S-box-containing protein